MKPTRNWKTTLNSPQIMMDAGIHTEEMGERRAEELKFLPIPHISQFTIQKYFDGIWNKR